MRSDLRAGLPPDRRRLTGGLLPAGDAETRPERRGDAPRIGARRPARLKVDPVHKKKVEQLNHYAIPNTLDTIPKQGLG